MRTIFMPKQVQDEIRDRWMKEERFGQQDRMWSAGE